MQHYIKFIIAPRFNYLECVGLGMSAGLATHVWWLFFVGITITFALSFAVEYFFVESES